MSQLIRAAVLLFLAATVREAYGDAGFRETFESPLPTWRLISGRSPARILRQERVRIDRDAGESGAEQIVLACPPGHAGVIELPIGRAPVIDELTVSLDVMSSQPGVTLAARVVFPRSGRDDQPPLSTLVRNESRYQTPEQWQTLRLEKMPVLAARGARLLRARPDAEDFDDRGAYIDRIALVAPGSQYPVRLVTDALEVHGVVVEPTDSPDEEQDDKDAEEEPPSPIELTALGFTEAGQPLLPRIWTYRGEAMDAIHAAGFNTVAIDRWPEAQQFADAKKHGLRVICTPPEDASGISNDQLRTVLAWQMPGPADARSLDVTLPRLEALASDDRLRLRPVMASPTSGVAAWSRLVDAVALSATTTNTSQSSQVMPAVRPGCAVVALLAITPDKLLRQQIAALSPTGKAPAWRDPSEIAPSLLEQVAHGAKGVWLASDRPLGGPNEDDRRVSDTLAVINSKLALIEPWLLGGERAGEVVDAAGNPIAVVFQRERTRLVLFHARAKMLKSSTGSTGAKLVLPGVAQAARVYQMNLAGVRPVEQNRVTGGVAIAASLATPGSLLIVTSDRVALRGLQRRLEQSASRAVAFEQRLATSQLAAWESLRRQIPEHAAVVALPGVGTQARRLIGQSNLARATRDWPSAYAACDEAGALLDAGMALYRMQLCPPSTLESSPLSAFAANWADELRLRDLLRGLPRGGNLLAGGDFEDPKQTRELGWRLTTLDGAEPAAAFTTASPKHGKHAVELSSRSGEAGPDLWITSPSVSLRAGQLVEITGWVRVERGEDNGQPLLTIADSLGGPSLAIRVSAIPSSGWRPFRMVRRTMRDDELRLTLALEGSGTAAIDAVMVRPIEVSAIASQPAAAAQRK